MYLTANYYPRQIEQLITSGNDCEAGDHKQTIYLRM